MRLFVREMRPARPAGRTGGRKMYPAVRKVRPAVREICPAERKMYPAEPAGVLSRLAGSISLTAGLIFFAFSARLFYNSRIKYKITSLEAATASESIFYVHKN
jgi:hypothetical protein